MSEPRWLSRIMIDAMHADLIREHGGAYGIRDNGLIESALDRPVNKWAHGIHEIAMLAAAYAFGLAKNHGYLDGNKRVALATLAVFLLLNGKRLGASEPEVVATMEALARGDISEEDLAAWISRWI